MKRALISVFITLGINSGILGQNHNDGLSLKIYSFSLNGDVASALSYLTEQGENLTEEEKLFKEEFESRFKGDQDESDYMKRSDSPILELQIMFRDYWRKSLLNPGENYMAELGGRVVPFLMKNYPPIREMKFNRDSLGVYLSRYIQSEGLYTQEEVDVSGHLLDLMVWKNQSDTLYSFEIQEKKLTIKVRRMRDFITLGWREYATLGAHYPGGWATKEALYMVEKAYDINSEDFRVSFLAHEGMHHLDLIEFPDLENVELEYRAKLMELSLADSTMYPTIQFFINNSNPKSEIPHVLANRKLINDLSQVIFGKEFEDDIKAWKNIIKEKINKSATEILAKYSEQLRRQK